MAQVETVRVATPSSRLNVADRLTVFAGTMPNAIAVACPKRGFRSRFRTQRGKSGAVYSTITFAELDADATRIAHGLSAWGVPPGTRLALLVRPGIEFVTLVFALLRAGMVIVLVDPGMGRRNLIQCLTDVEPEGFVAIGVAQAARLFLRRMFPGARWNVTIGRRWFWGGKSLEELRIADCGLRIEEKNPQLAATRADDSAAIIFTSGSTGPPKGVLYTHRMFDTQVADIRSTYDIEPGGVDLACFPLFALFNVAMGVTTVLPEMNFSRPANADPKKILVAANDWKASQAFASPAVWRVLSDHCANTGERVESLRQVFSCGAPVPAGVLQATLACVGKGAKMHTPYGATECLPVSTIEAAEVLGETAAHTDKGAGVCVGRKFDSIEWRVIRISDGPISLIEDAEELPTGEIGELIVKGPQASPCYVTRTEFNDQTKISEKRAGPSSAPHGGEDAPARSDMGRGTSQWHRMGDVGYVDVQGRFWYCGRKSQRVETAQGALFTECVEAIVNAHPLVTRSALVGVGPLGQQVPVIVVQPNGSRDTPSARQNLFEFASRSAMRIEVILFHPQLPTDVRHNAKINREQLRAWATKRLYAARANSNLTAKPNV